MCMDWGVSSGDHPGGQFKAASSPYGSGGHSLTNDADKESAHEVSD